MIQTRKIELLIEGTKEEQEKSWDLLRYYARTIPYLNNFIITQIYLNDIIQEKFALHDQCYKDKFTACDYKLGELYENLRKLNTEIKKVTDEEKGNSLLTKLNKLKTDIEKKKKEKNKFIQEGRKEAREAFEKVYGFTLDGSINEAIRGVEEFSNLPDTIISPAISELGFYKKEIWKIKIGQEKIRVYSKGMPFNTRGRDLRFSIDNDEFFINWVRGIRFKIRFGQDKSNNQVIIERIVNNEYKASDSKIHIVKGKIFLLLCVDIPTKEYTLDKNKILGIDLGIKIPAYISVNNGEFRMGLGSSEDFIKVRKQMRKRRERLQENISITSGGHGRKKRLKALNQFKKKERNWRRTYNHALSKQIINHAIKEGCGVINMEFLKGYGSNLENKYLTSYWSYYDLQKMIEYKAQMNNIEVKYIDPYRTSQTCSECGHYEEGQREEQETFQCKNCGLKANADYNASKNIARSNKYVSDIKECEYYKQKKSKLQ